MYVIKDEFDPVEENLLTIQQIFSPKRSDPDPDQTGPKSPGSGSTTLFICSANSYFYVNYNSGCSGQKICWAK
jgi:hypothetical protein